MYTDITIYYINYIYNIYYIHKLLLLLHGINL